MSAAAVIIGGVDQTGSHSGALSSRGADLPADGTAGAIVAAIEQQRVLSLVYADRHGAVTERQAEPVGLLWGPHGWYVLAWCRLREAPRGFRLDRIRSAQLLAARFAARDAMELHRDLAREDASLVSAEPR